MKRFRVKLEKEGKEYYNVRIFDYQVEIFDYLHKKWPHHLDCDTNAATFAYDRYKDGVKQDILGDVLFYKGGLGAGVVSHEMTHATNYWLDRRVKNYALGGKLNKKSSKGFGTWRILEEKHAYTIGYLVSQFYKKYHSVNEGY